VKLDIRFIIHRVFVTRCIKQSMIFFNQLLADVSDEDECATNGVCNAETLEIILSNIPCISTNDFSLRVFKIIVFHEQPSFK